jgi:uroporphyrinogen decarboxylase
VNQRENALRILRFDHPERVAMGMPNWGVCYVGCNNDGYDIGENDAPVGQPWTDIWGVVWERELPGIMGYPKVHPLAEMESLKNYQWPDPDDERVCRKIYDLARQYPGRGGGDTFLSGSHRSTLWERAYKLVGMENMMIAIHTEPGFAREVLHRIMDFQVGIARHYLAVGIEVASLGDDLGTQCGPLLGPQVVEEFLVPEYQRLFSLYRQRDLIIEFHSCGNIESVVETFIKLGVHALNPVQALANDLDKLRRMTQGRMALCGAVSTGTVMHGPAEKIEAEVRQRLWQLGREGGYFCSPDQYLPFPPAHSEAFAKAVCDHGTYPLRPAE